MTTPSPTPIGLAELIDKVKQELLSVTPGKDKEAPILFVDSIELELQVAVKREGAAGIKIDVLSFGGAEAGGTLSRDDVHTVKVQLSPLFSKERLMEFYQALHPDQIPTSVKQSLAALLKGDDVNPDSLY